MKKVLLLLFTTISLFGQSLNIDTVYNNKIYVHSEDIDTVYLYYSMGDTTSWSYIGKQYALEKNVSPDTTIFPYALKSVDYGTLFFKAEKLGYKAEIDTTFEVITGGRLAKTKAICSDFDFAGTVLDTSRNPNVTVYRIRTEHDPGCGWVNYWANNFIKYDGFVRRGNSGDLSIHYAKVSDFPSLDQEYVYPNPDTSHVNLKSTSMIINNWEYFYKDTLAYGSIIMKDLKNDEEYVAVDFSNFQSSKFSIKWKGSFGDYIVTGFRFDPYIYFSDRDGDYVGGKAVAPAPIGSPLLYDIYETQETVISTRDYFRGIHPKILKYGKK